SLQEELARLGFDPGPADGRYGLLTRQAVRECQRRYGLPADGLAGPEFLRLLREPALHLGPTRAVLGVVQPPSGTSLERWLEAYPCLSALVLPTPLDGLDPEELRTAAARWSQVLEAAGLGTRATVPWVWRILCQPLPREEGHEPPDDDRPAVLPAAPTRRARRELEAAIL